MSPSFNRYAYVYSHYPFAYQGYLGKRSADAEPEIVTDSGLSHYNYVRYRPYGNHYRVIGKRCAHTKPEIPLDTVVKDNASPMYTAAAAGYAYRPYGKHSADAEPQTDADAGTPRYYYA